MWIDSKGSTVLSVPECRRLLAVAAKEGWVGRIGVPTDQAPVIVPVNFNFYGGEVLARVGTGFLSRSVAGQLVAFEVDHVDERAGCAWSVLVRGLATLTETPSQCEFATAGQPLVPEPGDMIVTVRPDVLTGRRFRVGVER